MGFNSGFKRLKRSTLYHCDNVTNLAHNAYVAQQFSGLVLKYKWNILISYNTTN